LWLCRARRWVTTGSRSGTSSGTILQARARDLALSESHCPSVCQLAEYGAVVLLFFNTGLRNSFHSFWQPSRLAGRLVVLANQTTSINRVSSVCRGFGTIERAVIGQVLGARGDGHWCVSHRDGRRAKVGTGINGLRGQWGRVTVGTIAKGSRVRIGRSSRSSPVLPGAASPPRHACRRACQVPESRRFYTPRLLRRCDWAAIVVSRAPSDTWRWCRVPLCADLVWSCGDRMIAR
jgi:hypothetical protein